MANDQVSRILVQWARERGDLDVSPMGVIGRISRLCRDVEAKIEKNLAGFGLQGGRFDLLATLRRNGPDQTLNPTELQAQMMLSSGATTHRIDVLEKEGYVVRQQDPSDRRGTRIHLTEAGARQVDKALLAHLEVERQWLESIGETDRRELTRLLAALAEAHGV